MPYSIMEEDGRFCVHKDDDGMTMGCHDSREEAERQMAALYANDKAVAGGREDKAYSIRAEDAELDGNHFRGVPSVMGNKDDGDDVIAPGAFDQKVLDDFLTEGMVPIGHDWMDLPVAMPTAIKAQGNKLVAQAEFHTYQKAQDARSVMMERIARGKSVGLSIGFQTGETKMFENGAKLLDFAVEKKFDAGMFDVDGIKSHQGPIRLITKIARLFEFSIVSVPMNRLAVATAAKQTHILATEDFAKLTKIADFEEFLRDAGFSRVAAKQFISKFKGILLPRDAGGDAPDPDELTPAPDVTPDPEQKTEPDTPITPPQKPVKAYRELWTLDGRIIRCPL